MPARNQIYSDILTFLHQLLLLHLPQAEVESFWRAHPLRIEGTKPSLLGTLALLDSRRQLVPSGQVLEVLAQAERLCHSRGVHFDGAVARSIVELRHGHLLPVRVLSRLLAAGANTFSRFDDPRQGWLELLPLTVRLFSPRAVLRPLSRSTQEGTTLCHFVLSPDASFRASAAPWHVGALLDGILKYNPRIFGCEPYNETNSICHMRNLDLVAALHDTTSRQFAGARRSTFGDFLTDRGLEWIPEIALPDRLVEVAQQTVRCPQCHAVIVEKGAAYGAPCHVFSVAYQRQPKPMARAILHFARQMTDNPPRLAEVKMRQAALLAKVAARAHPTFRFDSGSERLYRDDQIVTRGATARMLHWMLAEHLVRGTREFARSALIDVGALDPHNPSFEVRIRRLATAVHGVCPELRLERAQRGIWRFESRAPFLLANEPGPSRDPRSTQSAILSA